jgi:hypothetical protein
LPSYRLYRLDGAGHISAADWIEAANDEEARSTATAQVRGKYELWNGKRLVERSGGARG